MPLSMGGSGPRNTWFHRLTRVHTQTASGSDHPLSTGHGNVQQTDRHRQTHRQTDTGTYADYGESETIDRAQRCTPCMRCGLTRHLVVSEICERRYRRTRSSQYFALLTESGVMMVTGGRAQWRIVNTARFKGQITKDQGRKVKLLTYCS